LFIPYSPYLIPNASFIFPGAFFPVLYTEFNVRILRPCTLILTPRKAHPMPGPWRLLSLRVAFLLAITLGLFLPIRIQAQASPAASAADSDEDDDKPVSFLYVTVSLDAAGKASVQASYHAVEQANLPPSEIKQALQSALGCTLENSPRARPFPGFYFGSCTPRSSAQGLLRQGRISTAPLQDFSRLHDIPSTSLQLVLPDSDVLETTPPVRRNSTNSSKTTASVSRYLRTLFIYTGSPNNPLPSEIVFRYGYASSTLKRAAAILFLVLLSPLALFIWFGRKALSANVADKAVVWFSYMRSLQWILNASLIVWWVALDYCHAEPLLRFLSSATRFAAFAAHPVAYEALSWVPPAVLWLLCYRVSHPIQQKLRGLHWTKRELTLQALYSVLAGLFPFALFLTGLRFIGTDGFRSAMLRWVAAFFLRVVAAQALLKVIGMQPQALSWGDLRDRAFAMAERLGVKLQQVYLIPSGKDQAANAFARTGNTISFTDFLLKRMSQREVDYVMAHELTHLKLKHPAKLGYANMGGIFLGIMVLNLTAPFLHGSVVARYALMFTIVSVFPFFWSRRFEYSADAGAVAATGDPRAAISALFKLSELNMMPLHWSKWREKWLTHPSSTRRAQAIAKKAGIPFEEIPAIAREGAAEIQSYTIPSTAAPGGKVHSTQRTKSITLKLSLVLIGLLVFVPSLFSLAAIYSPSPVKWILFVAAIPATFLSFLLLMNYSPRLTRGTTVHALDEKLASQGIQAASWSASTSAFRLRVHPASTKATPIGTWAISSFAPIAFATAAKRPNSLFARIRSRQSNLPMACPAFSPANAFTSPGKTPSAAPVAFSTSAAAKPIPRSTPTNSPRSSRNASRPGGKLLPSRVPSRRSSPNSTRPNSAPSPVTASPNAASPKKSSTNFSPPPSSPPSAPPSAVFRSISCHISSSPPAVPYMLVSASRIPFILRAPAGTPSP
jgi:Zn-dependent protease with chaperone function